MDESQHPLPDGPAKGAAQPAPGAHPPVEVAVTRSGGFAGMTRRWRAEPAPAEAPQWIALIAQCPWDAAPSDRDGDGDGEAAALGRGPVSGASPDERTRLGADRFMWWIHARCGEEAERETELADDEVVGAWRELVDAVRAASRASDR